MSLAGSLEERGRTSTLAGLEPVARQLGSRPQALDASLHALVGSVAV